MYPIDAIPAVHDGFIQERAHRGATYDGSTAMKKTTIQRLSATMLTGLSMLVLSSSASAQYSRRDAYPAAGACFFEDINFGGRYFCTSVGDNNPRVPSKVNDEISSIRVFGNAEVVLFRDGNMNGEARRFSNSVRDLRNSGFNDRMTSYVVQLRGYNGNYGGGYGGYDNRGYDNRGYDNRGYRPDVYGRYDNGNSGYNRGYGNDQGWRGSQNNSNRWNYSQAESMVRQAYRRVFNREPDPGARGWIEQVMQHNWSQRQLEAELRNTPEGRSR